jgi:hypothetical protein
MEWNATYSLLLVLGLVVLAAFFAFVKACDNV